MGSRIAQAGLGLYAAEESPSIPASDYRNVLPCLASGCCLPWNSTIYWVCVSTQSLFSIFYSQKILRDTEESCGQISSEPWVSHLETFRASYPMKLTEISQSGRLCSLDSAPFLFIFHAATIIVGGSGPKDMLWEVSPLDYPGIRDGRFQSPDTPWNSYHSLPFPLVECDP